MWKVEADLLLTDSLTWRSRIWPMIRMRVYYCLAEDSGTFSTPHPKRSGVIYKIVFLGRSIYGFASAIAKSVSARNASVLVFEHPRSKQVADEVVDVYSCYYVRDRELSEPGSVLVLARTESGKVEKTDGFDRIAIDAIEGLRSVAGRCLHMFVSTASVPVRALDSLCESLFAQADARAKCQRRLQLVFRRGVIEYFVSYALYNLVFSWFRRTKEIVLVDGYSSRAGLISAARKRGIRVTELQHGVLGRYHLGYAYPYGADKSCLPDELLVWSEFWEKELDNVWPTKITIYGYKYLKDVQHRLYSGIVREAGTVVVVSQGAISSQLAETLWRAREALSCYAIYYKLHPSEVSTWRDSESLSRISELPNVTMVERGDIYELFSRCEYQIGVFSTALHEGVVFGCKTVLVPLPGIEYMENFSGAISFEEFVSRVKGG